MNKHAPRIEENIDNILSTGFAEKHDVAVKVENIRELQYNDFGDLKSDMFSGDVIVRMAPGAISGGMFAIVATNIQKIQNAALGVSVFILPISGIMLGIFVNYWWFLLIIAPAFTLPLQKKVYLSALFNAVGDSEKAFCFAFCGNAITVECRDGTMCYRGMAN